MFHAPRHRQSSIYHYKQIPRQSGFCPYFKRVGVSRTVFCRTGFHVLFGHDVPSIPAGVGDE